MKKLYLLVAFVLALPNCCLASLIYVRMDYISEPNTSYPFEYGNHLNLVIDADLNGEYVKWNSLVSGTLEKKGQDVFDLQPASLFFYRPEENNDWAIVNMRTKYLDSSNTERSLWARIENFEKQQFMPELGPINGDTTFVDDGQNGSRAIPSRYSISSVDEPISLGLALCGALLIALKKCLAKKLRQGKRIYMHILQWLSSAAIIASKRMGKVQIIQ